MERHTPLGTDITVSPMLLATESEVGNRALRVKLARNSIALGIRYRIEAGAPIESDVFVARTDNSEPEDGEICGVYHGGLSIDVRRRAAA